MSKEIKYYIENGKWPSRGPRKRPQLWWVFVAMGSGYWALGVPAIIDPGGSFLPWFPIALGWVVIWFFIMAKQMNRIDQYNRRLLVPDKTPEPPHPQDDPASY